jgi:hypothetical protein
MPIAKSVGKVAGRRALKAGADIASDLIAGKDLKRSLKTRGKEMGGDLLEKAAKKMKGGRRKSIKGKPTPRKQRKAPHKAAKKKKKPGKHIRRNILPPNNTIFGVINPNKKR